MIPTSSTARGHRSALGWRTALALAVPGLVVLGACGSSSKSSSTTVAPTTAAASATTAPASATTAAASAATTAGSAAATTAGSSATTTAGSSAASTAPAGSASPATTVAPNGKTGTLKIGDIDSLTGTFAQYGVPQNQAIKLAIDQINKAGGLNIGGTVYMLSLEAQDDKTDAATGALAMQKLLGDGIHFFVGTLSSAVAGAYLPLIKDKDDVIDVVTGAAVSGLTDNKPIYRPRITQDQYEPGILNELQKIDPPSTSPKVANVYDQGNAGSAAEAPIVQKKLEALGYTVTQVPFTAGSAQFGSQITALNNAGVQVGLFGGNATDAATMLKESRQQGFKGDWISTGIASAPGALKDANVPADAMKGVYDVIAASPDDLKAAGTDTTQYTAFAAAFQAAYNSAPGFTSGSAFDGVYILADALTKAGSVTDFTAIHNALDSITVAQVPQLVESLVPQDPGGLVFLKHQSYFELAVHTWNGTAWVLDHVITK